MRTEVEIRQYRDAMVKLAKQPCDCAAEGHGRECQMGGIMMDVAIRNLTWALGDSDEMNPCVETILDAAAEG